MNQTFPIPLIKEDRISKLVEAMKCIDSYPYDRDKQRICILRLYPDKTEKSVFRGMIVPTLRYLGLIVGYGKGIRLSSNGKITIEGKKKGKEEALRVLQTVFLEIDKKTFGFVETLKENKKVTVDNFFELICWKSEEMPKRQKKERTKRWLRALEGCELVQFEEKPFIKLDEKNYENAEEELNAKTKSRLFKRILFEKYNSLPLHETAGIVDIPLLRELVAMGFYGNHNMILTESQFDQLLQNLPHVTDDYVISLGQPMGAEEKLFHYKGNYYRTLSVTFFKKK